MNLKRQTRIMAWITTAVVVAAFIVTSLSAARVRRETEEMAMAERIIQGVTNFRFLIMETVFYREPRSGEQWLRRVASFREMLKKQSYDAPYENALLVKEHANLETLARLHVRLTNTPATPVAETDVSAAERTAGIVSSLFLTTQDMLEDAFELQRLNRVGLADAQNQAGTLMLLNILGLAAIIAAGGLIITRRVIGPIADLQRGAERIANGDLSFRLSSKIANEIGVLSRTFDDMTDQLAQSRDVMLVENAERLRAQVELNSAVQKLELTLTQLQGILDAATDFSIISTDVDGVIKIFSSGAERMLGYTAAEVIDKTSPAIIHCPDEVTARGNELTEALGRPIQGFDVFVELPRQGQSESREWTYVRKDGTTLPVNLAVTSVRDRQNNITGFLGIAKDIGEGKRIHQALSDARDEATAASLSKGQFLANMSHEIRTPMNAILGMLQLLQRTDLSARQLDYANKTQTAAQSLLGLLNDILDFSKIEAGKLTMEHVPFQFEKLMQDLSVILSTNIGHKDIEVLFSVDPKLPRWVMGDVLRLQQVLLNLAGNAIKFTEHGEVIIALKVVARHENSTEVHFSVRDTGIGIAAEKLAYIFEGFSQAEASTTRRFGGTGLGLAISRRIATLMGGELKVESKLGSGSCFYFSATFEHADVDGSEVATLNSLVTQTPRRVLVVDDNPSAREVMSALVESLGWYCGIAASGQEALVMLQKSIADSSPYDVVFVDWKMPEMDGWETMREIRQLRLDRHTPVVIMITAHSREAFAERVEEKDDLLNGFLVKPITAVMLRDAVVDASQSVAHGRVRIRTAARSNRLTGLRLLVVEDTLVNQQVALELLSSEGALVEIADGGVEGVAMALAANPPFDLVLMDIQMPDLDGYAATRQIRDDARMQLLPIIAMTANVMLADKAACTSAGMNDHIGKPIDIEEIVNKVLQHCHIKEPVAPSPQPHVEALHSTSHEIELDSALRRLNGNTPLFVKLVGHFVVEAESMASDFHQHLLRKQQAEAASLLHKLKGIAGTVGAAQLAEYAGSLETRMLAAEEILNVDELVREIDGRIKSSKALLEHIAKDFSSSLPDEFASSEVFDAKAFKIALTELDFLLRSSNMQAVSAFDELRQQFGSVLGEERLSMTEAINRLDFKSASSSCKILMATLP